MIHIFIIMVRVLLEYCKFKKITELENQPNSNQPIQMEQEQTKTNQINDQTNQIEQEQNIDETNQIEQEQKDDGTTITIISDQNDIADLEDLTVFENQIMKSPK